MGKADRPAKPKLRDLDDLLSLNSSAPLSSVQKIDPSPYTLLTTLPLSELHDYPGHPFHLYSGERRQDMIDSIREKGIMQPLIVRETAAGECQILSGHNRKHCAMEAGLDVAPVIIKRDLPDEDAWAYVIETNLIQRSFSDLLPSEKAEVLHTEHSGLFSQGKRNDILEELEKLGNPLGDSEHETFTQRGQKLTANEKLGVSYGLSRNSVARYLRIHQLTPELKIILDADRLPFLAAVELSFLTTSEQTQAARCMNLNHFTMDIQKATLLRDYSKRGKLDDETLYLILSGELYRTNGSSKKVNRTPTVKVSKAAYAKYFTPQQSPKEVQTIVEQALEAYFRVINERASDMTHGERLPVLAKHDKILCDRR